MERTERFAELVARPPGEIPLDEAALLIAAHAHPELDRDVPLAELDRLAATVPEATATMVANTLFGAEGGFAGNTVDYGDPRNSYLDDVLARRLGIPISLSVVMIEVGRRRGVRLLGVGMPGHFLVCPADRSGVWFDPFNAGVRLDEDGCRALFERVHGPGAPFRREFLAPTDVRSVLARMLANLQRTFLARDPGSLAWVVRLRLRIPGVPAAERRQLAGLLGGIGLFTEAATELERLAVELSGDAADQVSAQAAKLRARGN